MAHSPIKTFEELAKEWAPRAKRFLSLVADNLSTRLKRRLPALLAGSAFLMVSVFCVGALGAWASVAVWYALLDRGFTASEASWIVVGGFAALGALFFVIGRLRARKPIKTPPVQVLSRENREIEAAGQDLITLFKDLTIAAKRSLSPNEVLKPHAVKVTVASAALGFLIALNLNSNPRKERIQ